MSSLHSALWLVVVAAFVLAWWLRRQRGRLRLLTTYVDALAAGEVPPPLPEPLIPARPNLQLRLTSHAAGGLQIHTRCAARNAVSRMFSAA
jgi:hypothetical protein